MSLVAENKDASLSRLEEKADSGMGNNLVPGIISSILDISDYKLSKDEVEFLEDLWYSENSENFIDVLASYKLLRRIWYWKFDIKRLLHFSYNDGKERLLLLWETLFNNQGEFSEDDIREFFIELLETDYDRLKYLIKDIWINSINVLLDFENIIWFKLKLDDIKKLVSFLRERFSNIDYKNILALFFDTYFIGENGADYVYKFQIIVDLLIGLWAVSVEEILDFKYFIKYNNIRICEKVILDANKREWYLSKKDYILRWDYSYRNLSLNDFDVLVKHRRDIENGDYVGNKDYIKGDLFSLLDIYIDEGGEELLLNDDYRDIVVETKLDWDQIGGRNLRISNKSFFDVTNLRWVGIEEQLLVNRIFASILPMARLLRLESTKEKNNKEDDNDKKRKKGPEISECVSVDVNNVFWKEVCGFNENTPYEIINFVRVIYQFLTMDFDRAFSYKNMSKDWIIFDFDCIFSKDIFFEESVGNYMKIFRDQSFYPEFKEIFFLIKNYVHNYCTEELEKYLKAEENINDLKNNINLSKDKKSLKKNISLYKKQLWEIYLYYVWVDAVDSYLEKLEKEDLEESEIEFLQKWMEEYSEILERNRIMLEKVLSREAIFSMSNFVISLWIRDEKILEFASRTDEDEWGDITNYL